MWLARAQKRHSVGTGAGQGGGGFDLASVPARPSLCQACERAKPPPWIVPDRIWLCVLRFHTAPPTRIKGLHPSLPLPHAPLSEGPQEGLPTSLTSPSARRDS